MSEKQETMQDFPHPSPLTPHPSSDPCILAIDLGTSGPKVALVSPAGDIVSSEREEIATHFSGQGGAEQRPDDWWSAIARAARRVLQRGEGRGTKDEGGGTRPPDPSPLVPHPSPLVISCTSQYSSTLPVDQVGRPLMNAISWMDTRGARYAREITRGWPSFQGYGFRKLWKWIRLTGGAPTHSGKDSLAHILYIQREHPEIYRTTFKFLEPKDYLNYRLTGKFAATYDSINLHWLTDNRDIRRIHYHEDLLAMAGVERAKLPDLIHATDIVGQLQETPAIELGLPAGIPVVGGTTDAQSSAIGSGAVEDYQAHLYLGTSSWLSCFVPSKKTDLLHNMASLPSAIPGRYYIANEQECAGACLAYLRDKLIFADDPLALGQCPANAYELFDEVAAKVPAGSNRVIFLPWMYGERTPIEDHTVRGGFFNLSLKIQRPCLVRAVLEGVAYNSRWLLECVEHFCGRRFAWLNVIGGGARSDMWCQILADVLNRTIRQVRDPLQANARGAGLVGSVAMGFITFADIASRVEIARTFEPNPANRALYDQLYHEFRIIYRRNKGIFARLNR